MNTILPQLINRLLLLAILVFSVSCGSSSDQDSKEIEAGVSLLSSDIEDSGELLLGPSPLPDSDLEKLINQGNQVDITDAKTISQSETDSKAQSVISEPTILSNHDPLSTDLDDANKYEAELALNRLEKNTINHQKSIEDLRQINSFKDETIASLSSLNDELLIEIKRLKAKEPKTLTNPKLNEGPNEADGKIMISELQSLKSSLLLKSTEIKDLRMRNDSLEKRISSLETSPMPSISLRSPKPSAAVENSKGSTAAVFQTPIQNQYCTLKFDAVVTSLNGKSKEAFYTEFFVVREDLETVMRKARIDLLIYPTIATYAELWARSRKNSFLFPGMQKKFRALLLDLVEDGKGMRVRTNIDGFASVENLNSGKYYVVGTASLGKVGVTWSVPVILSPGTNKLSLTLENAAWSL
tara:strand:- start:2461 stop:3696 length:1236 start_codon:yes stop_codon:yes gene_type:complete